MKEYRLLILFWLAFASVAFGQTWDGRIIRVGTSVTNIGYCNRTGTCSAGQKPNCDARCFNNQIRLVVCPDGVGFQGGCQVSMDEQLAAGPVVWGFGCNVNLSAATNNSLLVTTSNDRYESSGPDGSCSYNYLMPTSWNCHFTYDCLYQVRYIYNGTTDYSTSDPDICARTQGLAQGLVEARKAECTEGGGVFQNSNIVESQGGYCVSGSCNDCSSDKNVEILTDIFISHTDNCCSLGMEPDFDFDYKDFCMSPPPAENGVAYPSVNRNLALKCSDVAAGSGKNYCDRPPSSSSYSSNSSSSGGSSSSSSKAGDSSFSSSEVGNPSSSSGWMSSNSGDGGSPCLASSMRPLQKSVADDYDDGWVYLGKQAYKTISERQYFPTYQDKYFDASGRVYSSNKLQDKYYYYIDGNKVYKPRTVETYLEFEVWRKDEVDIIGNQISFFHLENVLGNFFVDSIYVSNGDWEILETDIMNRQVNKRDSRGVIATYVYGLEWDLKRIDYQNGVSIEYDFKDILKESKKFNSKILRKEDPCVEHNQIECTARCMERMGTYYYEQTKDYLMPIAATLGTPFAGWFAFGPTLKEVYKRGVVNQSTGRYIGTIGWTSIFSATYFYTEHKLLPNVKFPVRIGPFHIRATAGLIGMTSFYTVEGMFAFFIGTSIGTGLSCSADCLMDDSSW